MTKFKSLVTALAIATGLCATAVPAANAGLLLLPAGGGGLVLVIIGLIYRNPLLVILDADGSPNQDSLERSLEAQYAFIGDRAVISELASAIRAGAVSVAPDAQGRRNVRLDRATVLEILEPTGLVELEPAQVERLVADLG